MRTCFCFRARIMFFCCSAFSSFVSRFLRFCACGNRSCSAQPLARQTMQGTHYDIVIGLVQMMRGTQRHRQQNSLAHYLIFEQRHNTPLCALDWLYVDGECCTFICIRACGIQSGSGSMNTYRVQHGPPHFKTISYKQPGILLYWVQFPGMITRFRLGFGY